MLVADNTTNPTLDVVANAAKEIAELKAKVAKLEKLIDSVLAQHLAGVEPMSVDADFNLVNDEVQTTFNDQKPDEIADLTPGDTDNIASGCLQASGCASKTCTNACDKNKFNPDLKDPTIAERALPTSVVSLLCRPTKSALTSTDDLTLICGITIATALDLAAHDVSRFEDIAGLDARAILDLKQNIPGADRIHTDNWIEQAAILASGGLTAHARNIIEAQSGQATPEPSPPQSYNEGVVSPLALLDRPVNPIETTAHAAAPEIVAETTLDHISELNLPRTMEIERPMTTVMRSPDNATSFLPMAAVDAGFAVLKIPHHVTPAPRDYGHVRALTASLIATVAVIVGSGMVESTGFGLNAAPLLHADICQLTGLTGLAETCKQILASVL